MGVLVLSDTHGKIDDARDVISKNSEIELIIHLGDCVRDARKLAKFFPKIPIEYIYGNTDFTIGNVPAEKIIDYKGKRLFITHGHRYAVKWDYDRLFQKAEEVGADMIMFGHTHIACMVNEKKCILLNPGSISEPRNEMGRSYGLVEVVDGVIQPKIIYL